MSAVVAPPPFDYLRPSSLDEAVEALAADGAMALAGGTDLVTMRASGQLEPTLLVDIKEIAEIAGVLTPEDGVRVGAATRFADLLATPELDRTALADGAALVGAMQTRQRGTLGGNVCRSSPAGDTLPGLIVLGAELHARGSQGERTIPIGEFFTGPGQNVFGPGELLTAIELPRPAGASAYQRLTYRAWMDLAVIGVAVSLEVDAGSCAAARIALGGLAPTPLAAEAAAAELVGSGLEPEAVDRAVEAAVAVTSPITDVRGTSEYRVEGLRALLPRVIEVARERAGGSA